MCLRDCRKQIFDFFDFFQNSGHFSGKNVKNGPFLAQNGCHFEKNQKIKNLLPTISETHFFPGLSGFLAQMNDLLARFCGFSDFLKIAFKVSNPCGPPFDFRTFGRT